MQIAGGKHWLTKHTRQADTEIKRQKQNQYKTLFNKTEEKGTYKKRTLDSQEG